MRHVTVRDGRAIQVDIAHLMIVTATDGATDIPCFRVLTSAGGSSVAVFDERSPEARAQVEKIACGGNRVSLIFNADYRESSPVDLAVKAILDRARAEHDIHMMKEHVKSEFNFH